MKRTLIETADGSKTIYIESMDETYHSTHGAMQEAMHVFIRNGLDAYVDGSEVRVFELGFGTGLNALLTFEEAEKRNLKVFYLGLEAYPVEEELWNKVDYADILGGDAGSRFDQLHTSSWGEKNKLSEYFSLKKIEKRIQEFEIEKQSIDLIYFDAFGPRAQNEMWEITVLQKMYDMLKLNGMLVTYCAQGQFKRDLKSLGFTVECVPGPPGKREMTIGVKIL